MKPGIQALAIRDAARMCAAPPGLQTVGAGFPQPSQGGDNLGPDRDHAEKERERRQGNGLFNKRAEHNPIPVIRNKTGT